MYDSVIWLMKAVSSFKFLKRAEHKSIETAWRKADEVSRENGGQNVPKQRVMNN